MMTDEQKLLAVVACQQTVHRFYGALDAGDFQGLAALMRDDGVWHRQGKELKGPAAVMAALQQRPAYRTTAHMVQNLVIDVVDERNAKATFMTLVYRVDPAGGPQGPVPIDRPHAISVHQERLGRDADGTWRYIEKLSQQKFTAESSSVNQP
jgi:ketosteroid isomerase-like protein